MKPETIRVAITLTDGSTAIMEFVVVGRGSILPDGAEWIGTGWWKREPTAENLASEILRTFHDDNRPQPVRYVVVALEEIPKDRTFRDALVHDGEKFDFDMDKCREIHKEHLREAREPLFEGNDLALRDAMLAADETAIAAAKARRDLLRDITDDPRIDAAQTPEDLKQITLE